nr:hypothetical protein [Rectinema sp.]
EIKESQLLAKIVFSSIFLLSIIKSIAIQLTRYEACGYLALFVFGNEYLLVSVNSSECYGT